ncbi:lipid hydroperoxide peroxidase [Actinophytocola xinjiangensis]|uniref:Thiol peroxidase n=1 Tax=Actinophytocola xinjiangensis TaxID=485602 RepID=A0A7Z1AUF6_9PSEU|nr:thiol peroxidase [Actinophytocola xinjiangensis]OLF05993.1 lipid hydroperoxide peroxidase [Actinophytocola xinjiangensis]
MTATQPATQPRRRAVTTFRDRPVTLVGPEIRVGDRAPDFTVVATDMSTVTFSSLGGAVRVISAVPSLDTPVCDAQTRRFNQVVAEHGEIPVLTVSVDLPTAQARWCGAAGLDHVRTLSDHRDLSFGLAYGVLIEELRLLARAVFVVDADDTVVHAEYVPTIEAQPDYDRVVRAAWNAG